MPKEELVIRRVYDEAIHKPCAEDRKHLFIELENGIKALLVHDAECDKAACALSVEVGSVFDPPHAQGLAHFCEHMLFLGTEKYQSEDEYNRYLQENGGGANAFTSSSHTCYYFSVSPTSLEGAIDRFSQFFISPLFTESATDREMNAVDSEFKNHLTNDARRGHQLTLSTSNPNHPFNHFGTGNLITLKDEPTAKGIDIRQELLAFHDKYYSSNIMTLCIVGKENLEELENLVVKYFSPIQNKNVVIPKGHEMGKNGESAYRDQDLCKQMYVLPVRELNEAEFSFALPEQTHLWREKSIGYLGHLIGHEGEGSILSALKKEGLATELMAGSSVDAAGTCLFSVTLSMTSTGITPDGIRRAGQIIAAYINMLKNVDHPEWIYEEVQHLAAMSFRYISKKDAVRHAVSSSGNLHTMPPEECMAGPYLAYQKNLENIKTYLSLMKTNRIRLVMRSHTYQNDMFDNEEKFYGTKFKFEDLSSDFKNCWAQYLDISDPSASLDNARMLGLHLPHRNPFIAENFDLVPLPENIPPNPQRIEFPETSIGKGKCTLFFRPDAIFKLPKIDIKFRISLPFIKTNPKEYVMVSLFLHAVGEVLTEFSYDALVASISYAAHHASSSVYSGTTRGIELEFAGFSDKIERLMEVVAKTIAHPQSISKKEFNNAYDVLRRKLAISAKAAASYQRAAEVRTEILAYPFFSTEKRLESLDLITYSEFVKYFNDPEIIKSIDLDASVEDDAQRARLEFEAIKSSGVHKPRVVSPLFKQAHIEALVQGNITQTAAIKCVEDTLTCLGVTSDVDTGCLLEEKSITLSAKTVECVNNGVAAIEAVVKSTDAFQHPPRVLIRQPSPAVDNPNSAVSMSIVLGDLCSDEGAYVTVLCNWLKQKFFDDLRTKQQLGYIVGSAPGRVVRSSTYNFVVQSVFPVKHVSNEIEVFIRNTIGSAIQMSEQPDRKDSNGEVAEWPIWLTDAEFDLHRTAAITRLLEEPKKLSEETSRNFGEIATRRYEFSRRVNQAEFLKGAKLSGFVTFLKGKVVGSPWLLIEVESKIPPTVLSPKPTATLNYSLPKCDWIPISDLTKWNALKHSMTGSVLPQHI